jgi:hypothetical protein
MSFVNPDDFASEFGYWAENEDFSVGMHCLLENGKWRSQGKKAHEYVRRYYRYDLAAKAHTDLYATLLR